MSEDDTRKLPDSVTLENSGPALSRRSLLAGSAGLTLGVLGVQAAQAQTPPRGTGQPVAPAVEHTHGAGSLSSRLYQVNPGMPEHADIAQNPS